MVMLFYNQQTDPQTNHSYKFVIINSIMIGSGISDEGNQKKSKFLWNFNPKLINK